MEEYWGIQGNKNKRGRKKVHCPWYLQGFCSQNRQVPKSTDVLVPQTVVPFYLCIQPMMHMGATVTATEMFENILKEQNQFTCDSFFTPLQKLALQTQMVYYFQTFVCLECYIFLPKLGSIDIFPIIPSFLSSKQPNLFCKIRVMWHFLKKQEQLHGVMHGFRILLPKLLNWLYLCIYTHNLPFRYDKIE